MFVLASVVVGSLLAPSAACAGLDVPVSAHVVRDYAPVGSYGGHWGVDFGVDAGTAVRAADGGTVTFAGDVAGMLSVTIDHGGGLRTSYSYLNQVAVTPGQRLGRGDQLGRSGTDHGIDALHFSVRIGDRYQDPQRWLGCFVAPHRGLRLVPVPHAYAARRATRHSRRDLRSSSSGTPVCRGGGVSRSRSRRCDLHSGGGAMAESGS